MLTVCRAYCQTQQGRKAKEEKTETDTALVTLCLVEEKVITTKKSAFTSSHITYKLLKIEQLSFLERKQ